jgi:hypothetical protein
MPTHGYVGEVSTDAMLEFRQDHAGQFNAALRLAVELTGLQESLIELARTN